MNYGDIDHLLPRYCEGLATEEECRQVESWMEESEDNRKIVDQINTLYIAVDTVNVMRKVDTEKALKKVSSRMIVRKTTWWSGCSVSLLSYLSRCPLLFWCNICTMGNLLCAR